MTMPPGRPPQRAVEVESAEAFKAKIDKQVSVYRGSVDDGERTVLELIEQRDAAIRAPLDARIAELEEALGQTYRLLDECDHAGRSAPECPYCHPSVRVALATHRTATGGQG